MSDLHRREVSSRKILFFTDFAKTLVRWGLTPNQISIASSFFALATAISLMSLGPSGFKNIVLLGLAAFGIQLRLVCNLIDGLMAIEGGKKTPAGELFNDVPDRVSDILILLACGYYLQTLNPTSWLDHQLGAFAALASVLTAYVRTLGASLTGQQDFSGPMAKQHRMFIVTLACLGSMLEVLGIIPQGISMGGALTVIFLGSLLTCAKRLRHIYSILSRN